MYRGVDNYRYTFLRAIAKGKFSLFTFDIKCAPEFAYAVITEKFEPAIIRARP